MTMNFDIMFMPDLLQSTKNKGTLNDKSKPYND